MQAEWGRPDLAVQVKLTLFGQLRTLVDEPAQTLELPDEATVVDLFLKLSERYGERFSSRVMEVRHNRLGLQHHVLVFVNDEKVEAKDQATTRLGSAGGPTEVSVYIMQPFTGG